MRLHNKAQKWEASAPYLDVWTFKYLQMLVWTIGRSTKFLYRKSTQHNWMWSRTKYYVSDSYQLNGKWFHPISNEIMRKMKRKIMISEKKIEENLLAQKMDVEKGSNFVMPVPHIKFNFLYDLTDKTPNKYRLITKFMKYWEFCVHDWGTGITLFSASLRSAIRNDIQNWLWFMLYVQRNDKRVYHFSVYDDLTFRIHYPSCIMTIHQV